MSNIYVRLSIKPVTRGQYFAQVLEQVVYNSYIDVINTMRQLMNCKRIAQERAQDIARVSLA